MKDAVTAVAYPDITPPEEPTPVVCLPVARRKRRKALHAEEMRHDEEGISGLMLRPTDTPGVYVRVRCFDIIETKGLDLEMEYCYGEGLKSWFPDGNDNFLVLV